MTIRVLVVDDQVMVREGFSVLLNAMPDIEVVGEAVNGREAVRQVAALRPDVVLMDIRMPRMDGVEATRQITGPGRDGPAKVLVLTTFDLDEYVVEALRAGASGFLLKDAPATELVQAIRVVAAGEAMLAPSITRRLLDKYADQALRAGASGFLLKDASARQLADGVRIVAAGEALLAPTVTRRLITEFAKRAESPRMAPLSRVGELTERETEVLVLIAQGLSNAEIAADLFVSETTVKTHVGHVLTKLGLRDRVQAAVYAYESGLVRPGAQ